MRQILPGETKQVRNPCVYSVVTVEACLDFSAGEICRAVAGPVDCDWSGQGWQPPGVESKFENESWAESLVKEEVEKPHSESKFEALDHLDT